MESSASSHQKEIVDEVFGFIVCYSDGSIHRPIFPGGTLPACPDFVRGVASKDVTLAPDAVVWARIFLPQIVASSGKRAPLVLHFHGGGLCSGSADAAAFHKFCSRMALQSESIWVSINYRLAPEHRLPTAYDDAYAAFGWLHSQATQQHDTDPWLRAHADFANCFLAGESSGGAIVHYLTMMIIHKDWSPFQVRGLLIVHPAFLIDEALDRSADSSFERRPNTYRRLSLPIGANMDDPLVNPIHSQAPSLNDITLPPSVVAVAEKDKLSNPGIYYVKALRRLGHKVDLYVSHGEGHCFYLSNPKSKEAELLQKLLVDFIRDHVVPVYRQCLL